MLELKIRQITKGIFFIDESCCMNFPKFNDELNAETDDDKSIGTCHQSFDKSSDYPCLSRLRRKPVDIRLSALSTKLRSVWKNKVVGIKLQNTSACRRQNRLPLIVFLCAALGCD